MAHFTIQLATHHVVLDLDHDDITAVRDELVRTRYLIGKSVDMDNGQEAPAEILISAASIRWVSQML